MVNNISFTEEDKLLIKTLYLEEKLSLKVISLRFNCSVKKIFNALEKLGVKRRDKGEKTIHTLDITFFKPEKVFENPLASYWLGWIFGDGHIRKDPDYVLSLVIKDGDQLHLGKFAVCVDTSTMVKKRKNSATWRIEIKRKIMYEQLYQLGKRKDNLSESTIPLNRHIIRGICDSDGHLAKYGRLKGHKTKLATHRMYFLGGKVLLEQVQNHLIKTLKISKNAIIPNSTKNGYQNLFCLTYAGKTAVKVVHYLYQNAPYLARLERKYEIYEKYFLPFAYT